MSNEKTGMFGRLFGRKNRDDVREISEAPAKETITPQMIVEENRTAGMAIARALENVMAMAGISEKLGTQLQRERRVTRLRALRDGYRDMPAIEADVRELDRVIVECAEQTARCVEAGDVMTLDFSLDALEHAVRIRLRITPQSVEIIRLFVNRSKLSMDVFDVRQKLDEHERTLQAIKTRGDILQNEFQKQMAAGKKYNEARMERLAIENNEKQQEEVQTAIDMLKTTLIEYEGHVTSFTVRIDGSNLGGALTAEDLDEVIKMNLDANEKTILDFQARMKSLETANDAREAQMNITKNAIKDHQMNTLVVRAEPETVQQVVPEQAKETNKEELYN
jgi:hypothetical protein